MGNKKRTTINIPADLTEAVGTIRRRMPTHTFNDILIMLARRGVVGEQIQSIGDTLDALSALESRLDSAAVQGGTQDKFLAQDIRKITDLQSQLLLLVRYFLAEIHGEHGKKIVEKARHDHQQLKARVQEQRATKGPITAENQEVLP